MLICTGKRTLILCASILLFATQVVWSLSTAMWNGVLSDSTGKPVAGATVTLHSASAGHDYSAVTAASGRFDFPGLAPGAYEGSVKTSNNELKAVTPVVVKDASALTMALQFGPGGQALRVVAVSAEV